MLDNVFIDSNIIIYAYSIDEPTKRDIVNNLLNSHEKLFISTQTVNEFINVILRKKMLSKQELPNIIDTLFSVFSVASINQDTIQKAINISNEHHYSYFDSLMIASALENSCSILYSEDMHHEHTIDKVKIINPFLKHKH